MKAMWGWYGSNLMFVLFALFFGFGFIHFALSTLLGVPIVGFESLDIGVSYIGVVFTFGSTFFLVPFLYHLHVRDDSKYVEEIKISLDKFKIHDYNTFIVVTYADYAWMLKKAKFGFDLNELKFIPFRKYYDRKGNFNFAIPTIRYIK